MEHVRMRVAHEPISAELVDVELVELKFIFDRRKCSLCMTDITFKSTIPLKFITITETLIFSPTINHAASQPSMSRQRCSGRFQG